MTNADIEFSEFLNDNFRILGGGEYDPMPEIIENSKHFIHDIRSLLIQEGLEWLNPSIYLEEEGWIEFCWRNKKKNRNERRSLTFLVGEDTFRYMGIWRRDIKTVVRCKRMQYKPISVPDTLIEGMGITRVLFIDKIINVWRWFLTGKGDPYELFDGVEEDDLVGENDGNNK